MGTAVLRSQDCLQGPLHLNVFRSRPSPPPPSAKSYRKKSPASSTSTPIKPARSFPTRLVASPPPMAKSKPKANPPRPRRKSSLPKKEEAANAATRPQRVLVMEEVKILKRGEELKPAACPPVGVLPDAADSVLCAKSQLEPGPDVEPVYAGPGFVVSPSPSSLPLPTFFLRKAGVVGR